VDFFEFYPLNTPNSNSLPQPNALIFNRHHRQEEARTTKEDVADASAEGEQERWFGERGHHELSEMESGTSRDCCWGKSSHPCLQV